MKASKGSVISPRERSCGVKCGKPIGVTRNCISEIPTILGSILRYRNCRDMAEIMVPF